MQLEICGRPDHGCARYPVQQRDLSEPVAGTEPGDQAAVFDDIRRALLDHVVAVSRITLTKHHGEGVFWPLDLHGRACRVRCGQATRYWAAWAASTTFSSTYQRFGYDMREVDTFRSAVRDTFLGVRLSRVRSDDVRGKQFDRRARL